MLSDITTQYYANPSMNPLFYRAPMKFPMCIGTAQMEPETPDSPGEEGLRAGAVQWVHAQGADAAGAHAGGVVGSQC